jgi:hypothetical protein
VEVDYTVYDAMVEYATEHVTYWVGSRTEDELKEIALQLYRGQIFTSEHIAPPQQEAMLPMVFLPIVLGGLATIEPTSIGLVYEYLEKAGPRSINGYPIFMSCKLLNLADTAIVLNYYDKYKKAMDAVQ